MNDLNHLFELLGKNEMPNFLEVMAALSNVSELYPDNDQDMPRPSGSTQSSQDIPDCPCNPSRPTCSCKF